VTEPDWFGVDEAARALKAYDLGMDVGPDVWEQDTPEAERQDYRREAARIAIVVDILRKRGQP
jgi:hypothetical protein